jgi:Methyltransferase domain
MFKVCTTCQHRCELPKLMRDFRVGVEVGVCHGSYSESLLRGWSGFLHLVDPWKDYAEYTDPHIHDHDYNFDLTMSKLKCFPTNRWKIWREQNSDDLANRIGSVDFCYLDGNHELDYISSDIRIWWKHLKPNGILAGHDLFHMEWADVTAAVVLFAKEVNREVFMIPGKQDCPCGEAGVPSWYLVR